MRLLMHGSSEIAATPVSTVLEMVFDVVVLEINYLLKLIVPIYQLHNCIDLITESHIQPLQSTKSLFPLAMNVN